MIGFVIWSLFGVFIIGLGIKDMFSKNPVGFWANTETIKVKDVKGYNRASGLLFIIYGIIFVILGIPLLEGQNTPYVLLSVIGVMVETIVIMAAYSLVIVKSIICCKNQKHFNQFTMSLLFCVILFYIIFLPLFLPLSEFVNTGGTI